MYAKNIHLFHFFTLYHYTERYLENHGYPSVSSRKSNAVDACSLRAHTHTTVGDFIMSNWTDLHFVHP